MPLTLDPAHHSRFPHEPALAFGQGREEGGCPRRTGSGLLVQVLRQGFVIHRALLRGGSRTWRSTGGALPASASSLFLLVPLDERGSRPFPRCVVEQGVALVPVPVGEDHVQEAVQLLRVCGHVVRYSGHDRREGHSLHDLFPSSSLSTRPSGHGRPARSRILIRSSTSAPPPSFAVMIHCHTSWTGEPWNVTDGESSRSVTASPIQSTIRPSSSLSS